MRTGKAVGRLVEWFFGLGTSFAAAGFGWKHTAFNGGIFYLGLLLDFGVCLRGPCTSQCSVGQLAVAHIRISISLTLVQWSGNNIPQGEGALPALTSSPTIREPVQFGVWPEVLI